tara:strand:- start:3533 stop:4519 length:987 start_codon:yes stop_codon:yes gene_type:complete
MTEPSSSTLPKMTVHPEDKMRYKPNNIYKNPVGDMNSRTTHSNGLVIEHLKHRGKDSRSYFPTDSDPYYFVYNLYEAFKFEEEKPMNEKNFKILPYLKLKSPQKYCLLSFREKSAEYICILVNYFQMDFTGGMPLNPSHIKALIWIYTQGFIIDAAKIERARRRLRNKSRVTSQEEQFKHWDDERLRNIENGEYMVYFEEMLREESLNEYQIAAYLKRRNINLFVVYEYENRTSCRVISTTVSRIDQWVVLYKKKNNVFEIVALYTSPGRCKLIMNSEEFLELILEIADDTKIFKNVEAYNEASMKSISLNPEEIILDQIDEYYEQYY